MSASLLFPKAVDSRY